MERSRPSLRERNKQRITKRIVAAAYLFYELGYEQTTMDAIAEAAKVSRATLFNYFPTKASLLVPLGRAVMDDEVNPQLAAFLETQPATGETIQFLFARLSEAIFRAPDVARVFVREALTSRAAADSGLASIGVDEAFAQVLEYGRARGEVRTDIPVELTARYLTALHAYLVNRFMDELPGEAVQEEIARLSAFVLDGLAGPAGSTLRSAP